MQTAIALVVAGGNVATDHDHVYPSVILDNGSFSAMSCGAEYIAESMVVAAVWRGVRCTIGDHCHPIAGKQNWRSPGDIYGIQFYRFYRVFPRPINHGTATVGSVLTQVGSELSARQSATISVSEIGLSRTGIRQS